MKIRLRCPGCQQAYSVDGQQLGERSAPFVCRRCGISFHVGPDGSVQATVASSSGQPPGTVACPACGHQFQPGGATGAAPPGPARPTVLVAEDTAYFRELVKETLGDRYRTILVSSKADALAALRREKVDLLLLDLSLDDDVDGREVLREMGSKPCPILIFTARDEEDMYGDVWTELKRLGADDMLIKGMNVEENLLLKIEHLLPERP